MDKSPVPSRLSRESAQTDRCLHLDGSMLPLRDMGITAIDFEGTGSVQGYADEPWQVGLIQLKGGKVDSATAYERLLRVGDRPFNPYAPGRHRQLRAALREAPTLPEIWPELKARIEGSVLVGHNIATEKRYLTRAFPLHPPQAWVDTLALSRWVYPGLASYKLEDVLASVGLVPEWQRLQPGREAHDALYDAVGSAVLLSHFLQLPVWCHAPLPVFQQTSRRKQR